MQINSLKQHVLTLATVDETDAPMVSCYLNLEGGIVPARQVLDERVRLLQKTIPAPQQQFFEQALLRLQARVAAGFHGESRGAAMFSRGGDCPFFLDLEVSVPLPTWIAVGSTPNIYHLVELKDTYDRYVVVLVNERSTRVLEVHLGEVTKAVWARRPELRERVGRGWSREHYQSHRRERNHQYAKEIAQFLEEVMASGGYRHLILAGTPKITALLRQALPTRLRKRLVDVLAAAENDRTSDIVAATLATFVDKEQRESLAAAERLRREIWNHGLAVAGPGGCLQALRCRQADLLVMAAEYVSDPAWTCIGCHTVDIGLPRPPFCPRCGRTVRDVDLKEELVRRAEIAGCEIEIVHDSDLLMSLGGVGCLLRSFASHIAGARAAGQG